MRSNPLLLTVSLATIIVIVVVPNFATGSPISTYPNLLSRVEPSSSDDEWIFRTTSINTTSFQTEPYVANGYIGARLPAEGMGLRIHPAIDYEDMNGTQGWPLFSLRQTASIVVGFYGMQNKTRGTNFVSLFICSATVLFTFSITCFSCSTVIFTPYGQNTFQGAKRWRAGYIVASNMDILISHCLASFKLW
jgi:hypothetical protein